MEYRHRVIALHAAVMALIPSKVDIFNFSLQLELGGMVGENLNHYFLIQNIPGLNPKSPHNTFIVKAYVFLIVIYPLDKGVKQGSPLGAFQ